MTILTNDEISSLGLASVGINVYISSKASFYGSSRIHIGDNVRIDDFCVISAGKGGIYIGDNIHIAVYTSLIGDGKISIGNYSNLSSRVSIYSSSDDYSGHYMTNPMVPKEFTDVFVEDVIICDHVIIGSGTIILPGVTLENGVAIGALSLVKNTCEEFFIYAGQPANKIKKRSRNILALEKAYEKKYKNKI